jgi:hypothetical protein
MPVDECRTFSFESQAEGIGPPGLEGGIVLPFLTMLFTANKILLSALRQSYTTGGKQNPLYTAKIQRPLHLRLDHFLPY